MNIALLYPTREKNSTGVRNLTKGTIMETLKHDKTNNYILSDDTYFNTDILPFSNIKWGGYEQECRRFDFMCYCKDIDIIHSYWNSFDLMRNGCKKILTIYDLIPLIHPEWHTMKDYFDGPIRRTALMSDLIITDSNCTKNDVINYYNIPEECVKVVYPGLLHSLDFNRNSDSNHIMNKFGINDEYIMSVSTIEPRKNLRGLIKGFLAFKQIHPKSTLKLVLVGGIGWDNEFEKDIVKLDEFRNDIILTGFVSDEEMLILYKNMMAFAYVSYYEGFGLPILEAMSAGKAVISSSTSSMPEVAGNAGCYCNPYDIDSIEYAIEKVVFDNSYREELQKKAKLQATKFSYEKAALETIAIYNELGER